MAFFIPDAVRAAFEHLKKPKTESPDGLDWARDVLKRAADPLHPRKPSPAAIQIARDAIARRGVNK